MTYRLVVHIAAGRIWAESWNGAAAPSWRAESDLSPGQRLADALAVLVSDAPPAERHRETTVLLHRPVAQVRHLENLPPVRSSALAALVDHQAGTFFRKNGHPLVTSAGWLPTGPGQPRRAVLAAVDVEIAEAAVDGMARAGFVVDHCTVAGLPGTEALDLLPMAARQLRRQRRRRSLTRLAAIAATAWIVAIAALSGRYALEVHRTRAELHRLEGARQALLVGQAVRHRAEAILTTLDAAAAARQRLQDRLLAVAAALPDSAYLTSLVLDTLGSGLVTGGAHRATEVVAAFERAHAVANPRLEGAVTPDPLTAGHWERFTILLGEAGR